MDSFETLDLNDTPQLSNDESRIMKEYFNDISPSSSSPSHTKGENEVTKGGKKYYFIQMCYITIIYILLNNPLTTNFVDKYTKYGFVGRHTLFFIASLIILNFF